ncbi:MAG TPA: dockerin type I domain-containing protein [Sedimentisphaerales bacterium]|nr:dockerin type I domain-containing protein [Sedimentisphaerales bacterium]
MLKNFGGHEMKKLAALLVVMMIAAPSMAGATVSGAQVGTTAAFTISYADDGVGSFPRAFALNVTTSAGTISGVTATRVGQSTSATPGFGIFPGTIAIDTAGNVTSHGTPVAPQSDLPGGTLGGIGTNGVTLEMGSLYVAGGQPLASGTLATVSLAGLTAGSSATITITPNVARGGIVLEDATSVGAFTRTFVVTIPAPAVCRGDVNRSGAVTVADVLPLVTLLTAHGGKARTIGSTHAQFIAEGDVNRDGSNSVTDVLPLVTLLTAHGGKARTITCPHAF